MYCTMAALPNGWIGLEYNIRPKQQKIYIIIIIYYINIYK